MDSIQERCRIWRDETGRRLHFHLLDVAKEYERLKGWLAQERPDAIIHFAVQRPAPYSMKYDSFMVSSVNSHTHPHPLPSNTLTTPTTSSP